MAIRSLKSFFPTADELLALDMPHLGPVLLTHLKSYEGVSGNTVFQHGKLHLGNLLKEYETQGYGPSRRQPEYGDRQPEVNRAVKEAWGWLGREGFLTPEAHDWWSISREGEKLLKRTACFDRWESLGLDRVKSDLENNEGRRTRGVGSGSEELDWAWEWVRTKESKPPLKRVVAGEWVLIAESRLDELRALTSSELDFRKLIRLCEELNINSREECHYGTAMLTRGLLDHVPPIFGKNTFSEVANNYGGGGRSFKETMHHLENAARKVADSHLHTPIRKSETLPTAQQVNFAAQLDVLLSEIVRITQ
jgi:hypothetical protein